MQVSGIVAKVRESSYPNKKTGEKIDMVYIDLLDETAGVIQVEMRKNGGFVPQARMEIRADVEQLRKINFGSGVSVVVKTVRAAMPESKK